eukprot:XP_011454846.1 PREDICTED: uncharacterized protein LOC105347442 isoform X1 [Crassostrea gigas]
MMGKFSDDKHMTSASYIKSSQLENRPFHLTGLPILTGSNMNAFLAYGLVMCLVAFTSIPVTVQGSENDKSFYDCKVYSKEEDRPTEKTECVHDYQDGLYYCKTWECEVPSCPREEQVDQEGEPCPLCPGTCTTGGKIYSVGETVSCNDRVNSCGCISTGQGFSTLIATNKYSLCGAPFPIE